MTIDETCTGIESFFVEIRGANVPGLWLRDRIVPPHGEPELSPLFTLDIPVPDDVLAFLRRGLRGAEGSITAGDHQASIGFDFLGVAKIVEKTTLLRDVASNVIAGDRDHPCWEHGALANAGIAMTYEEPQLLVTRDGVYHFSYRNPLLRVAASFGELLADYLASGCFKAGTFGVAREALAPYVSPTAWTDAYTRTFGDT